MEQAEAGSKAGNVSTPRRALGRGLGALLPSAPAGPAPDAVQQVPITAIAPNPHQPRQRFHPERLQELSDSIKVHGIMQPIVVRRQTSWDGSAPEQRFMIIAGERRWRAAAMAGLTNVPALVRDVPDSSVLELTLIENIQREDLNPIEVAEALARLAAEAKLTHEQIAERTGKDRVTVTNLLRLLRLPQQLRDYISEGKLSLGHAKALMGLPDEEAQKALGARIVVQGLSVRQAEGLVKGAEALRKEKTAQPASVAGPEVQDPNIRAAVLEMERALGVRVRLEGDGRRGKIVIEYHTPDDLDRIYSRIVPRQ